MIAYQRALARALTGERVAVPGVDEADVARYVEIVFRKRLTALRALLPRTLAACGRAAFEARYRAFAHGRESVGPEGYRDEAVAFARSVGLAVARVEARIVAAYGPSPVFTLLREGWRFTLYLRFRRGDRLRVVRFGIGR
ncbi:MAG: hypothetical protein JO103_06845 [Candidatus Eremiobacteraeota bacterium]|nr:hypothetical protein [Candidatus Eremiobacteraeota bacterium]MBV9407779.1 hypothetical protein [Candidatus Eremiobacteraeota bacterium]